MNEMEKKIQDLLKQAKILLDESTKAIDEGDLEAAQTKREESNALIKQAEALKANIDAEKTIKSLEPEEEPSKALKPPFEVGDPVEPEQSKGESIVKHVHQLRYGDVDASIKAVALDIWPDYFERKESQKMAFAKFLRYGDARLSAKEHGLLRELIYTPTIIKSEVKSGFSVAEIKSNKTTQQESSLELGGFLVPEDWRAELIMRLMAVTTVRPRARVVQTVRDAIEWPRLDGGSSRHRSGVRVTWVDAEVPASATVAQTNFTLGAVRVPVHTVMARTDVSMNLLEDAGINVPSLLQELFAEEMAVDEDDQFLVGNGAGRPQGVLGVESGAEATPVTGVNSVASGNASAITSDGLIDLVYELDAQYLPNAVLTGAKQTFRDIRKLKDGNGDYLWARGIERGAPPTVLGYDYLMNEGMPAIAANAYPIIFGDWRGYLIADRVGMTVKRVEDTTTTGTNTVAFFARRRLGGQVIEPWRLNVQQVSAS